MLRAAAVVGLIVAIAAITFAIGRPWISSDATPPARYVAGEVATTEETQQFDLMWQSLESLQKKADQIPAEQFKREFLASTTDYLHLDPGQIEAFVQAVDQGLEQLGQARDRLAQVQQSVDWRPQKDSWNGADSTSIAAQRDAWARWSNEQRETSDLLLAALQPVPRHQLLAERRLLWLLKLDFSLRKAGKSVEVDALSPPL